MNLLLETGKDQREIAIAGGPSENTISRMLNRNSRHTAKSFQNLAATLSRLLDRKISWRDLIEDDSTPVRTDETATDILINVLEFAARLVASTAGLGEDDIRALCHRFDSAENVLMPVAYFVGNRDSDTELPVSVDDSWFIIARAYKERRFVCDDIEWSKSTESSEQVSRGLKSVAAYPILPWEIDDSIAALGTVCVDSSRLRDKMGWLSNLEKSDLRRNLQTLADTAYRLLSSIDPIAKERT
ncbi:MAG: hypothetical protein KDB23_16535 [Planctomycetales bacterium]|nr:hypothetical protein [Planctomycetales bacterium]